MAFADHYLARHAVTDKINTPPAKDLRQIIVIPCLDEPALVQSLESLWSCERPSCAVEVIIVINSADNAPDEILASNTETLQKARQWIRDHHESRFMFHIIYEPSMPARYAGPGLARKTGMDQAVLRFNMLDNPHGTIISLDADTTCRPDYLKEIESCFSEDQDINGCTVYFEHPVEGKQYADPVYRAIAEYELHLRYYIEAIRHTGFPHACHTIGSAFCVSASAYVSQGGMNKRKAGEENYFLRTLYRDQYNLCLSIPTAFRKGTLRDRCRGKKICRRPDQRCRYLSSGCFLRTNGVICQTFCMVQNESG